MKAAAYAATKNLYPDLMPSIKALMKNSDVEKIYPEQDAFNTVCSGGILRLPQEYNAGRGTAPYGRAVIRHFMGEQKTYRTTEIYHRFLEMPWSEVRP